MALHHVTFDSVKWALLGRSEFEILFTSQRLSAAISLAVDPAVLCLKLGYQSSVAEKQTMESLVCLHVLYK